MTGENQIIVLIDVTLKSFKRWRTAYLSNVIKLFTILDTLVTYHSPNGNTNNDKLTIKQETI